MHLRRALTAAFFALTAVGPTRAFSSSVPAVAAATRQTTCVATEMAATPESYTTLCERLREINALEGISGLLGWDEMVMMQEGSSASRGAQKEALASVLHEKKTSVELGALLDAFKKDGSQLPSDVARANVRDAAKDFVRETAMPADLVKTIAKLETEGYNAWIEARGKSDFSLFAPVLQRWVDANVRKATSIDADKAASQSPYDVLLDEYEKGLSSARIDSIFAEVREGLVPLINDIRSRGTAPDAAFLTNQPYDVKKQAEMCQQIALDIGFDTTKGRLDVSVHPFTGGSHPTDVRMTTRYKENDVTEGLTGAVHETGHSLYEQNRNLDEEWRDMPVNKAMSMGVHESQSLLWERMVTLSRPFQDYLLPKLQQYFPDHAELQAKTADELYGAINLVKNPSTIRVEADEVTYTMHVILRYEIERSLCNGQMTVADVPRVWKEKMMDYLGHAPESDAKGCLQDVHWSAGAMGYFPTYSLGAMYATQIFEAAGKHLPTLDADIAAGRFAPLREWLKEKIHRSGSFHPSGDELMVAVTGKPLDPQVFLRYLREKYTEIYKL